MDLQRLQEEMREVKKERDTLESSLVMTTTNYRQKLTASIDKAAGGGEDKNGAGAAAGTITIPSLLDGQATGEGA